MGKKLLETTNLCVEIMNSKRQVMGNLVTWFKLEFAVNVMLNLSIGQLQGAMPRRYCCFRSILHGRHYLAALPIHKLPL